MQLSTHVRYACVDGVATIALDRAPVNALSLDMLRGVLGGLRYAEDDDNARVVVLRSARDGVFCAGLDLKQLAGDGASGGAPGGGAARALLETLYVELLDTQHGLTKPTLAAIDGAARGGGITLAISCDMLFASETASFAYPEIDLGAPPAIHFAHLPRIVGRHRAFDLLFSGRSFDAAEAAAMGLVSRILPHDGFDAALTAAARSFAAKSRSTTAMMKAAFVRENDAGYRQAVARAVDLFCAAAETEAMREGLAAFAEKRPPKRD